MRRIIPCALDLTSTGLIGSTLPVACTRTVMSPRLTVAAGRGAGPVVLALHAARTPATDTTKNVLRRRNMARKVGRCSAMESYGVMTDNAWKQSGAPERRRRHVHSYESTRRRGLSL